MRDANPPAGAPCRMCPLCACHTWCRADAVASRQLLTTCPKRFPASTKGDPKDD